MVGDPGNVAAVHRLHSVQEAHGAGEGVCVEMCGKCMGTWRLPEWICRCVENGKMDVWECGE